MKTETSLEPLLYRRRDASRVLACCESQCLNFERRGLLKPIKVGERMIRYDAAEVKALAKKLIAEAGSR